MPLYKKDEHIYLLFFNLGLLVNGFPTGAVYMKMLLLSDSQYDSFCL